MTNASHAYQIGFHDGCDGKPLNVNYSNIAAYVQGWHDGRAAR